MKLSRLVSWLGLALAAIPSGPVRADHVVCGRTYIIGLWPEHERGIGVLGNAATTDPATMSVYITPTQFHGQNGLYVQSNFRSPQGFAPVKAAVTEDVDIDTLLAWIVGGGRFMGLDKRGITFYVDPSFYQDPVYGKYAGQLTGRVVRLTGQYPPVATAPEPYSLTLNQADQLMFQKDFAGALPYYQKAAAMKPDSPACHYLLGYCLYKQGLWDGAVAEFNRSIQLDGQYLWSYVDRGRSHLKLNRPDLAMADFNQAVQVGPYEEDGYYNRGFLYRKLGQYDKALDDFDRSVRNNPKDPDALVQRGLTLELLGQYSKAIADYRLALQLRPNDSQAAMALKRAQARVGI